MKKIIFLSSIIIGIVFLSGCSQDNLSQNQKNIDPVAPNVINTFPQNGSRDVDSNLTEIWVEFNEGMLDNSWSWAHEDKNTFPELNGNPVYTDNNTKCKLPVKLQSNHEYVIWINTEKLKNFKDRSGNPAIPYKLSFKTK